MYMEVVHFKRIRFEGTWSIVMIDPDKQVHLYDGSGTIRVLREGATGNLVTYVYQFVAPEKGKAIVIAANCVIHVPAKATLAPGEVFP
jgi:hypothetical protein